ncbi:hypothetical protein [Gymnodinialimonas ceratoperidinii]|uniref:Uncharacterized protein n=1 Tax=Gymnodinialimonas ceratoperidinii TaxID=2856823 RepID=A0A8F6YDC6_9RHOB|nr:hypothetical protein [Gymnodinialimonas ceratoperidinii]QXT40300.1 hypothetical protein KYE46_03345 [Gymnodinialimonas ceratoperidinii]
MIETTFTAQDTIFAPMQMTHVANTTRPAPSADPFDWSTTPYGADSFIFRPDITDRNDTKPAP